MKFIDRLIKAVFIGIVGFNLFSSSIGWAGTLQSTLSLGLSYLAQNNTALIGQSGYFVNYKVGDRDKWLRPVFGGQIEMSSGTDKMLNGQMQGGLEMVATTAKHINPYIGVQGLFGSASITTATLNYIGLLYGVQFTAGAEIRFGSSASSRAFQIGASWRNFFSGSIGGGVSGSDLNALLISIGMAF